MRGVLYYEWYYAVFFFFCVIENVQISLKWHLKAFEEAKLGSREWPIKQEKLIFYVENFKHVSISVFYFVSSPSDVLCEWAPNGGLRLNYKRTYVTWAPD